MCTTGGDHKGGGDHTGTTGTDTHTSARTHTTPTTPTDHNTDDEMDTDQDNEDSDTDPDEPYDAQNRPAHFSTRLTEESRDTLASITHQYLTPTHDDFTIPRDTFSLYHTNIRSLSHKHAKLTHYIQKFTPRTPDIITLTDTFMTGEDIIQTQLPLPNYTSIHQHDVSLYYKSDLHVTTYDGGPLIRGVPYICIHIHNTNLKTDKHRTIISMYKRPRVTVNTFIPDLTALIDDIRTQAPLTTIDIQGDMNIDLQDLTPDHKATQAILLAALRTTITTPTRYCERFMTATLIDWSLTTATGRVTAGTLAPPLADHLGTLTIHHRQTQRQKKCTTRRLTHNEYERKKTEILAHARQELRAAQPPHGATNDATCRALIGALARTVDRYSTKPRKRRKPWCNKTIQKQIRLQHRLHKKMLAKPTAANIRRHKECRRAVRRAAQEEKRVELAKALHRTKGDLRAQAAIIRELVPNSSKERSSPTRLKNNGVVLTDPQQIADALNTHYITIGNRTAQTIPAYAAAPHQPNNPASTHPPFQLHPTTMRTVLKMIRTTNPHKASDIFGVKPAIIKDLAEDIAPIVVGIFNRAVQEGSYPDVLKVTKVIELYKGGDVEEATQYRPISLLPIIAKLIDKLINTQLMKHLVENNMISHTQYAFRPNSNTTMALQTILTDIHKHRKRKQPTLAIYVDLSKAYDTVSHPTLMHKLENEFNFTPATAALFRSYFEGRTQSTHTQHAQSSFKTITHGIPQGSTLSTTLFLLYINDITNTVPDSAVSTYADDTTLVVTAPTVEALQKLAQSELGSLVRYFHTNNLVPNAKKTCYSVFYPKGDCEIALSVNSKAIHRKKETKLLGLYVEESLKHYKTVNHIVRKLAPLAHAFRYATRLLPTCTMKELYNTHVYPHLIYALPVWGTDRDTRYLRPLVLLHKRFVRLVRNVQIRAHTQPLMESLDILTIPNLYILRVCAEMHPHIHPRKTKPRPKHIHHYPRTTDQHGHATRRARESQKHLAPSTEHYTQRYVRIWNELPQELRATGSLATFKGLLKAHLMAKQSST